MNEGEAKNRNTKRCVLVGYSSEYWTPAYSHYYVPAMFQGTLLSDKSDHTGQLYRRNRYYVPASGRVTQEDPIGLAGGLNSYGFANGDPVNFSDPFGLCPVCLVWAGVEAGFSLYDLYDLGKTAVNYSRGRASKLELSVTAAGAGIGFFTAGGGLGKASRLALRSADSWGNAATLGRHFRDHGAALERGTPESMRIWHQTLQRAQKEGLPTKIDRDGVIRVFDPATNTFGAFNANGTTRTFFKPTSKTYWDSQPGSSPEL